MSKLDYRTKDDTQISFYVFEDLRFAQNGGQHAVHRYDDLDTALAKYLEVPKYRTPALGIHLDTKSELDLIQRREGEHVLITDYLNYSRWRNHDGVCQACDRLCEKLNIQWKMDSRCMPGSATILLPLERGFERVPDRAFLEKNLLPKRPLFYGNTPDPITSINEAFVEGEGWMKAEQFRKKAEAFGYHDPHCLKVKQFNINYVDNAGHIGQADITPLDMQILQERYKLRNGDEYAVKRTIEQIAEAVAELTVASDPEREAYTEQLKADFSAGITDSAVEALEAIRDYGDTDHKIARAHILLARVHSVSVGQQKDLDEIMRNASSRRTSRHREDQARSQANPER